MVRGRSLVVVVNQFCIHLYPNPWANETKGRIGTSVLVIIVWDEILRDRGQI